MASRAERQMALREMARLADRRSYLLKEATRMINDDDAPAPAGWRACGTI